ncbi:hypothetical protein GCM10023347_49650 [Streptomyces chumphonensis]|uniref:GerMN domain-containing protein n=1 Tax=Streptomyces chumphonensis TaxID=1214925 RepID=A0A927IEG4_9ACTN|nr:hypothetical protein [Streptomyces chumphonensis]MBD3933331.1 hypothetical protein [Streptomyces chumphonensis]
MRVPGRGRRGRRAAPLAACAALTALLLGGCGIAETEVVGAGDPAAFPVVPHPSTGLLFFRTTDGRVTPVIRFLDEAFEEAPDMSGVPDVPEVPGVTRTSRTVAALFAGPRGPEREIGLTDGLPDLPETPVRTEPLPDGGVEVLLPIALAGLDDLAVRQIVCTAAFAEDEEGRAAVRLRGADTVLPPAACEVDGEPAGAPTPTSGPGADPSSTSPG